jgi:hypothetical protein
MKNALVVCTISLAFLFTFGCWGADSAAKAEPAKAESAKEDCGAGPWYFFSGSVNNHPRLREAQKQMRRQIDGPFGVIAPGFRPVRTFADQRDEMMISTPYVGVGRKLSKCFDLFYQIGFSAGQINTRETRTSILLLPFHADVNEKRSSFFTGPGVTYFPLGMAELRKYHSFCERLRGARPFVVGTLNYNYLTFKADIKAGFQPFGNFLVQRKDYRYWNIMSSGIGFGVDIPFSARTVISMNAQYTFFWSESNDFSGPGFSFMTKYFF